MKLRRFHYWIGVIMAVWILNAAVTGTMRANAKALYWKDRVSREAIAVLSVPDISIERLYEIVSKETGGEDIRIRHLEMKSFLGQSVYLVEQDAGGALSYTLVDANNGKVLSPLKPETAKKIAQAYVPERTLMIETEAIPSYLARKAKKARPVYRVLFGDSLATEIFIDRDTGEVLTILDKGRRFGMWMVKLHELDFAGLHRPASTAVGIGTILITMTGLILAIRSGAGSRKRRKGL